MATVILRRRRLGRTSCREIARLSQTGIVCVRNDAPTFPEGTDLVIRWGCTSNVPTRNVLNTAEAIHQSSDKLGFRQLLEEHELGPATWFNAVPPAQAGYPMVIRPPTHAQGRNLWVVHNPQEAIATINANPVLRGGYYIAKLINKVAEYRVFVVQGRVACVAQKTPGNPDDVAWNVARGGRFDNVRWDGWPLKAVKTAVQAFNLSRLDFGGVDVMVDAEGNAYVLEINSAPSLTSEYRQRCMATCFDWVVRNGKERIPLVERRGGYRKVIHPAVCDNALVA